MMALGRLRLLLLLLALALLNIMPVSPQPTVDRAGGGIIVPAYFPIWEERGQTDFNRLEEAAARLGERLIVVLNMNNGVADVRWDHYDSFVEMMNRLLNSGATVLGYVYTLQGWRDWSEMRLSMDRWLALGVRGIFLDESSYHPKDFDYYHSAYNYVKSIDPTMTVVLNHGIANDDSEIYDEISDIVVVREEMEAVWAEWWKPQWVLTTAPTNVAMLLILSNHWECVIALAQMNNIGWFYSDMGTDPWRHLSDYFELVVDAVESGATYTTACPERVDLDFLVGSVAAGLTGGMWFVGLSIYGILRYRKWRKKNPKAQISQEEKEAAKAAKRREKEEKQREKEAAKEKKRKEKEEKQRLKQEEKEQKNKEAEDKKKQENGGKDTNGEEVNGEEAIDVDEVTDLDNDTARDQEGGEFSDAEAKETKPASATKALAKTKSTAKPVAVAIPTAKKRAGANQTTGAPVARTSTGVGKRGAKPSPTASPKRTVTSKSPATPRSKAKVAPVRGASRGPQGKARRQASQTSTNPLPNLDSAVPGVDREWKGSS